MKGTPAGRAASAKDAPTRRLGAGCGSAVGAGGDSETVGVGFAGGVTFVDTGSDAEGEHAVSVKRKAAASQDVLVVRFMRPCEAFCRIRPRRRRPRNLSREPLSRSKRVPLVAAAHVHDAGAEYPPDITV